MAFTNGLTIEATTQGNGWTFRLSPRSRAMLCERFGSIAVGSSLFIGTDAPPRTETIQVSTWHQIAMLLTGIGLDELRALGGYQVIDSRSGRLLSDHGTHDAA